MLSKIRSLLEITDFTVEEIDELVALAMDIIANPKKYADVCKSKKLATLFYEPSTRTRLSFTAAMMELGGNVLGFSDAAASSVSKGEVVADTVRVVENFADIIAMRHNKEGAPWVASQYASIPIINASPICSLFTDTKADFPTLPSVSAATYSTDALYTRSPRQWGVTGAYGSCSYHPTN